jgi:hypothetical protein
MHMGAITIRFFTVSFRIVKGSKVSAMVHLSLFMGGLRRDSAGFSGDRLAYGRMVCE